MAIHPEFNTSVLDGRVLLLRYGDDDRLRYCGRNNLARVLSALVDGAGKGPVALVEATNIDYSGRYNSVSRTTRTTAKERAA